MKRTALLLALIAAPAQAAGDPFGRWRTDDGSAIVAVTRCGQQLCGRIERVLDPRAPANDANNPDPVRRRQPLAGREVLSSFSARGGKWEDGRAYDPKSGRSYRSELAVTSAGKLKVTGCVLMLCRSRLWTRVP